MPILEFLKIAGEAATGVGRPARADLPKLARRRRPLRLRFADDGFTPNHPRWPLLLYRGAVRLPRKLDPAAVMEDLLASNGWCDSWRNGVYDFLHYHSRIHETLGVARGRAKLRFGGSRGRSVTVKAGDVAVIPAGVGHQCLWASDDFLVVGAYPATGTYDECRSKRQEHDRAVKRIAKVPRPRKDPLFGTDGPLRSAWTARDS